MVQKILALDSSTEACSVALLVGEDCIEEFALAPREHTQKFLPMVDQLLAKGGYRLAELDALAFSRGPGSFTGLRICLGVVQGLAYGAELPVVAISSLACLAQTAIDGGYSQPGQDILAVLDARMDEVYWGAYGCQDGLLTALVEEQLSAPENCFLGSRLAQRGCFYGAGNGWAYQPRLAAAAQCDGWDKTHLPRASALARLAMRELLAGNAQAAELTLPHYLRDEVAWKKLPGR